MPAATGFTYTFDMRVDPLRIALDAISSRTTILFDGEVVLASAPIEAWRYAVTPTHFAVGIPSTDGAGQAFTVDVDDAIVTIP